MGTDPSSDWPNPPYRRDRSPIAVAAEHGFGTVNLDEIDFEMGDLKPPLAEFNSVELDSHEKIASLRHTASHQALFYRDNFSRLTDRYAGSYIFLQNEEVVWNGSNPEKAGGVQHLSGETETLAVWLKLVDPEEKEGERMRVYEQILAD